MLDKIGTKSTFNAFLVSAAPKILKVSRNCQENDCRFYLQEFLDDLLDTQFPSPEEQGRGSLDWRGASLMKKALHALQTALLPYSLYPGASSEHTLQMVFLGILDGQGKYSSSETAV